MPRRSGRDRTLATVPVDTGRESGEGRANGDSREPTVSGSEDVAGVVPGAVAESLHRLREREKPVGVA